MSAVVMGAVAKRLELNQGDCVYMTPCKRNFGIVVNRRWSDYRHKTRDSFQDPKDGKWRARDQMDWLLRKGDLILSGKPKVVTSEFHWKFDPKERTERQIKLVVHNGKKAADAYRDLFARTFSPGNPYHTLVSS